MYLSSAAAYNQGSDHERVQTLHCSIHPFLEAFIQLSNGFLSRAAMQVQCGYTNFAHRRPGLRNLTSPPCRKCQILATHHGRLVLLSLTSCCPYSSILVADAYCLYLNLSEPGLHLLMELREDQGMLPFVILNGHGVLVQFDLSFPAA